MSINPINLAEVLGETDVWDMTLPWSPGNWRMDTLARFKLAGFTFASLTLQDWPPTFEGMLACIQRFKEMVKTEAAWLTFGSSLAEIDQGRRDGKLVLGINSQETLPIGMDLSRIEALHAIGVRHMLLAYNIRNFVADGCAEVANAGLSNFGRQVVKEMNRVGIIVDCTHTGLRSSLEAIELSERPSIFSHSGAYAVCAHIRNIHDEQIRACAANGGVVGVVGIAAFVGDKAASTESLFRHIDHIATLVGPEHVGLGLDYLPPPVSENDAAFHAVMRESQEQKQKRVWPDPTIGWPDPTGTQLPLTGDCVQPEQLTELVELMLARGYSVEVVKAILGGNFRRVYATLP